MKNNITLILKMVIPLITLPTTVQAAPEDFILRVNLTETCDQKDTHGDLPHFTKHGTVSIARYRNVDEDYFFFEDKYDFGDEELKSLKMYWMSGNAFEPAGNKCEENELKNNESESKDEPLHDEPLICAESAFKDIKFKEKSPHISSFTGVEHLYGYVVLRKQCHKIFVYQKVKANGEPELYIENKRISGGPVHGGHAHKRP